MCRSQHSQRRRLRRASSAPRMEQRDWSDWQRSGRWLSPWASCLPSCRPRRLLPSCASSLVRRCTRPSPRARRLSLLPWRRPKHWSLQRILALQTRFPRALRSCSCASCPCRLLSRGWQWCARSRPVDRTRQSALDGAWARGRRHGRGTACRCSCNSRRPACPAAASISPSWRGCLAEEGGRRRMVSVDPPAPPSMTELAFGSTHHASHALTGRVRFLADCSGLSTLAEAPLGPASACASILSRPSESVA